MARHRTLWIIVLWCALTAGGVESCYSPTLPIPPPARSLLTVSPPDAEGWVLVAGHDGIMDPGDQAVIINTISLYGWIVPVSDEGGFTAQVQADPGDELAIQRRSGDEQSASVIIEVPAE